MTAPGAPDLERAALGRAAQALRLSYASLPHLSGLARVVRLRASRRVPVAAVSSTGLVLVNPDLFAALTPGDAAFVLAHELLHLALDTHGRGGDADPLVVNFAHDYIINDILAEEMGREPPLDGLTWHGARARSLEELIVDLSQGGMTGRLRSWAGGSLRRRQRRAPSPLSRALRDAGLLPPESEAEPPPHDGFDDALALGDMIPRDREPEFDPELTDDERRRLRERVRREAAKAASLGNLGGRLAALELPSGTGDEERGEELMRAVRGAYHTPWELALQSWMDAVAPGPRTFARPSRRGADRTDCVLPGRRREGWALHVVLDTSGSMADVLPQALGALASFCEGAGVAEVHVLQCDEAVTHDDWVAPEALDEYRIGGFGGSDMSPGLDRLAEDPEVAAALVLTDGYIAIPAEEPPFRVLWVLLGDVCDQFAPPYGVTIVMAL
jgi:hypothetical protein